MQETFDLTHLKLYQKILLKGWREPEVFPTLYIYNGMEKKILL